MKPEYVQDFPCYEYYFVKNHRAEYLAEGSSSSELAVCRKSDYRDLFAPVSHYSLHAAAALLSILAPCVQKIKSMQELLLLIIMALGSSDQ